MIRRPPRSTHRYTLFPYTTLFRSTLHWSAVTVISGAGASGTNVREAPMEGRSEEHTSELQSHSGISYDVFCLKKKNKPDLKKFDVIIFDIPFVMQVSKDENL